VVTLAKKRERHPNIRSIEDLPSMEENMAKKAREEGYVTIEALATESPAVLTEVMGIGIKTALKIIGEARNALEIKPILASDLLEEEKRIQSITTGSSSFDEILAGGVWTGSITEIAGAYGTGKTQLCFQLCINAQIPQEEGGLEGSAYFIDTEGTFFPGRIVQMALAANLDSKEILSKILVSRAYNTNHLTLLISEAKRYFKERNIKLLIIDSIASHFRAEFTGKEAIPARQQLLMRHGEILQRYADIYDIAILVTNQVLMNPDAVVYGKIEEPALGLAWAHRPTHRILLRKSRGTARIARIFDSPILPERECVFYITENGISDSPET